MPCKLSEILLLIFIFNEYCSQFCVKMLIYYHLKIDKTQSVQDAMIAFHLYTAFFCLSVVLVDLIANSRLGEFWTIAVLSLVSVTGYVALFAEDILIDSDYTWWVCLLIVLAVTTGGNFTCVKFMCYSQYSMPDEKDRYKRMLFTIVVFRCLGELYGSLSISLFSDVSDPGSKLNKTVFIVVHKVIGTVFILSGYPVYRRREIKRNYLYNFVTASFHALKRRRLSLNMDNGDDQDRRKNEIINKSDYEKIKMIYHVLPLYAPIVVILAFKEQKFTTFVYQTEAMSKTIAEGVTIHPLTILSFFPFFTLLVVLIFHGIAIPMALRYGYNFGASHARTLLAFSCLAISFAAASIVEIQIEENRPPMSKTGIGILLIYNALPCQINIGFEGGLGTLNPVEPFSFQHSFQQHVQNELLRVMTVRSTCFDEKIRESFNIKLSEFKSYTYCLFYNRTGVGKIYHVELTQPNTNFGIDAKPWLRIIYQMVWPTKFTLSGRLKLSFNLDPFHHEIEPRAIHDFSERYNLFLNESLVLSDLYFASGTFYTILIVHLENEGMFTHVLTTSSPKEENILYLIPQIFFMSVMDGLVLAPGFIYNKSKLYLF
ncbi:peptide transporter family 1-like isoform X2 [Cimex lectularius]|uniref:Uncharacterized protein n=1 Tax=Cimex lectularius TaxID=79782 RepID=A0A8I6TI80_CIMLE|nr:peptide transporter family 1-like isoform X2 [Cimex lectularius]